MSNFFKRNLKGDPVVWMIWFLLIVMSIIEMFSASSYLVSRSSITGPIVGHITFIAVGFVALLITQSLKIKYIRILGYFGLFFSIFLLIFTFFKGTDQAGTARFLPVGPFQFQPSEFARLALLIVAADLIDRYQNPEILKRTFWVLLVCAYVVLALIVTENLSTAVILGVVITLMLFVGAIPWKKIFTFIIYPVALIAIVLIIAAAIPEDKYIYNQDNTRIEKTFYKVFGRAYTWVARVKSFTKDTDKETKFTMDGQYQFAHAQIAIARGGVLPSMPGSSVQRDYLPEAYSDFIFAIIVEELGLMGAIAVILLYLALLYRAGVVAKRSPNVFSALLVIGVTLIIVFQAFVHMGVSVGLVPLTGQPLPLISKGGTSILINSIYFGLIIAITRTMYNDDGTVKDTKNNYVPIEQIMVDEENETTTDDQQLTA